MTDEKLDYTYQRRYSGRYDYVPATATNALPTSISTSGGETEIWSFPVSSWADLYNIVHSFTLTAASGNSYKFLWANQLPFRQIIFTYNGRRLCDVSNAILYTNLAGMTFNSKEQLKTWDRVYGSAGTSVGINEFSRVGSDIIDISPSFTLAIAGYAATATASFSVSSFSITFNDATATSANATIAFPARASASYSIDPDQFLRANLSTDFMYRPSNVVALTNTTSVSTPELPRDSGSEAPVYLFNGNATTAVPSIRYRWRLGEVLKGCIFSSIKQDFPLNGVVTMQFIYEATTRWMFHSTSSSAFTGVSTAQDSVTIGNQSLLIPIQRDEVILDSLNQILQTKGMPFIYDEPYLQLTNMSASTNQQVNFNISPMFFDTIKMVFFAPYNSVNTGILCLDHRLDDVSTIAKIQSFYTILNGKRQQSTTVDLTLYDDWVLQKRILKSSMLSLSSALYKYFWVFVEPFGSEDALESIESQDLEGKDGTEGLNYSIVATTTNRSLNWLIGAIGQHSITIMQNGQVQ